MIRNFLSVLILFALVVPSSQSAIRTVYHQRAISSKPLTLTNLNSIRSIALLEVPDPAWYYFGEGSGWATEVFGVFGGFAEGAALGKDSKEYGDFSFGKIIQDSLKQNLQENNYKVVEIPVTREKKFALIEDYNSLDIDGVDAYIDIAPISVGYKQSDRGRVYYEDIGPILEVVVRLISAKTKEVLYADTITYGWAKTSSKLIRSVDFESPPEHQFINKADLKANKERAIEQLIQGIERVSLEIARKFSRGNSYSAKIASLSDDNLSDLNVGSDDELLFLGMAAEEITSKSYDKTLWDRALGLAEGDEQKRKGIYIRLRSNQLALEKNGAQAIANHTGTYSSEIKGLSTKYKKRYSKLNIVQNGNKITGSFGNGHRKFEGSIEGDTFEIYWFDGWAAGEVKFKVGPDDQITGNYFWGNGVRGQWNLHRLVE